MEVNNGVNNISIMHGTLLFLLFLFISLVLSPPLLFFLLPPAFLLTSFLLFLPFSLFLPSSFFLYFFLFSLFFLFIPLLIRIFSWWTNGTNKFYIIFPPNHMTILKTETSPCSRVHKRISLMSSSLLPEQCPACLVPLTKSVYLIESKWLRSRCFVKCCFHDFFSK